MGQTRYLRDIFRTVSFGETFITKVNNASAAVNFFCTKILRVN